MWLRLSINAGGGPQDPYPSYAVPLLSSAAGWNFTLLDPLVADFAAAMLPPPPAGPPKPATLNLPVSPTWMWRGAGGVAPNQDPNQIEYPFDRYGNAGTAPADPTLEQLAGYFGRVASWYLAGGFVDTDGTARCNGHRYPFTHYEVLNEPSYAHNVSSHQLYVDYYDAITRAVLSSMAAAVEACGGPPPPRLKFVGLEQGRSSDLAAARLFLNRSRHRRWGGAPIDAIAWHFYCHAPNASGAADFEQFFGQIDAFVADAVRPLLGIRDRLMPGVAVLINEFGTELPGDIDSAGPAATPPWRIAGYQAAAAAAFAYAFGLLAQAGVDNLGLSQFVGHAWAAECPNPMNLSREYYPGLSMVDWATGTPTARLRTVAAITARVVPGQTRLLPDDAVRVTSTGRAGLLRVFAFRAGSAQPGAGRRGRTPAHATLLLVVNKGHAPVERVQLGPPLVADGTTKCLTATEAQIVGEVRTVTVQLRPGEPCAFGLAGYGIAVVATGAPAPPSRRAGGAG